MNFKNIALFCTALALTSTAFAAQLIVRVAPGVDFSQLQKRFGENTPVTAVLDVQSALASPVSLDISSGTSGGTLSGFSNTTVDNINPVTDLTEINPTMPMGNPYDHFIPFSFSVVNTNNPNQVFYQCNITPYVYPKFGGNQQVELLITGLQENDCRYVTY